MLKKDPSDCTHNEACLYNINNWTLGSIPMTTDEVLTKTFTVPVDSDFCYIFINISNAAIDYTQLVNFQLEEGNTATSYEPYGVFDSATLRDNVIFTSSDDILNLNIIEPNNPSVAFGSTVNFSSGNVATTFVSHNIIYRGDNTANGIFTPVSNKRYTVFYFYNGINVCGSVQGV